MNERIQKLAEQAGLSEGVFTRHNGVPCDLKGYSMLPDEMQKFAELIVKECGLWFNNRLVVEPDYGIEHRIERNRAVVGVMREFNQHFG